MPIHASVLEMIGNTPIVKARHLDTGVCELYFKLESQNPGGSIKDRICMSMIEAAEKAGKIRPGDTLVEGTAGNTGIGLAHVCNARGYRCVIVMPDNQSPEKYQLIEALGAEVRPVKAVPYADPHHYQKVAARTAAEIPGAIWANQFDNTANARTHFETTGPEIWEQTEGRIDAFVSASGTGGTLAGVSRYLKSRSASVRTVLADPPGSSLYEYVRNGVLKPTGASSITEGIGIGRVTENFATAKVDEALHIEDAESVHFVYRLLNEEGLFLGSTSGINVAAAVRVARALGPGHRVVTVLCDGGGKYLSRLFNPAWLEQKNLRAAIRTRSAANALSPRNVLVA